MSIKKRSAVASSLSFSSDIFSTFLKILLWTSLVRMGAGVITSPASSQNCRDSKSGDCGAFLPIIDYSSSPTCRFTQTPDAGIGLGLSESAIKYEVFLSTGSRLPVVPACLGTSIKIALGYHGIKSPSVYTTFYLQIVAEDSFNAGILAYMGFELQAQGTDSQAVIRNFTPRDHFAVQIGSLNSDSFKEVNAFHGSCTDKGKKEHGLYVIVSDAPQSRYGKADHSYIYTAQTETECEEHSFVKDVSAVYSIRNLFRSNTAKGMYALGKDVREFQKYPLSERTTVPGYLRLVSYLTDQFNAMHAKPSLLLEDNRNSFQVQLLLEKIGVAVALVDLCGKSSQPNPIGSQAYEFLREVSQNTANLRNMKFTPKRGDKPQTEERHAKTTTQLEDVVERTLGFL